MKLLKKDAKNQSKPKNNQTRKLSIVIPQGQVKKALGFVDNANNMTEKMTSLQTSKIS